MVVVSQDCILIRRGWSLLAIDVPGLSRLVSTPQEMSEVYGGLGLLSCRRPCACNKNITVGANASQGN